MPFQLTCSTDHCSLDITTELNVPGMPAQEIVKSYHKFQENGNTVLIIGDIITPTISYDQLAQDLLSSYDSYPYADLEGEFSIIIVDNLQQQVRLITDKLGLENVFYTWQGSTLYLSDSIFLVLSHMQDIQVDNDLLTEMILFTIPIERGATCFAGVRYAPLATTTSWDLSKPGVSNSEQYFHYQMSNEITEVTTAVDALDTAFHQTIQHYIQRVGIDNQRILSAISGGIDSRILPHYLIQNNCRQVDGYLIGEQRKHLIDTWDVVNAKQICSYYDMPFEVYPYNDLDLQQRLTIDVLSLPLSESNMHKIPHPERLAPYDILINGAYGTIIGGHVINDSLFAVADTPQLVHEFLMPAFGWKSLYQHVSPRTKALRKLFGIKKSPKLLPFITQELLDKLETSMNKGFEHERFEQYTIFEKYLYFHLTIGSKDGGFESLSRRLPSFSLYSSFALKTIMKFHPDLLRGRIVLEELLCKLSTQLAKIYPQGLGVPYRYSKHKQRTPIWKRLWLLIQLALRGITLDYNAWSRTRSFTKLWVHEMQQSNPLFDDFLAHLGIDTQQLISLRKQLSYAMLTTLLQKKKMLDIVHTLQTSA